MVLTVDLLRFKSGRSCWLPKRFTTEQVFQAYVITCTCHLRAICIASIRSSGGASCSCASIEGRHLLICDQRRSDGFSKALEPSCMARLADCRQKEQAVMVLGREGRDSNILAKSRLRLSTTRRDVYEISRSGSC